MPLNKNTINEVLRPDYPALISVIFFSFFTSALNLVPPLYMMQLSERVMLSRNHTTLLFLTIIALFLIVILCVLDAVRHRAMRRLSVRLDERIGEQVFTVLNRCDIAMATPAKSMVLGDLNTVRDFIASQLPIHIMDVFWIPLVIAVMFLLHPLLGAAIIAVLVVTVALSVFNQWVVGSDTKRSQAAAAQAQEFARAALRSAETARVMGMLPALQRRWRHYHRGALGWQHGAIARAEYVSSALHFIRGSQQVVLLLVSVLLYLAQEISAGAVFAVVFIGIRAIMPITVVASSWRNIWNVLSAVERLNVVLSHHDGATHMALPRPVGAIAVSRVSLAPPNADGIVLNDVSFSLANGRILGVVGPSGAGKSSLAKLLVGAWRPRRGSVSFDGHDISHWDQDALGRHVGYVPQEVELLPGTVAENIARFGDDGPLDYAAVLEAAELAGIQDIIQALPNGYDTRVGFDGHTLSGGQRQRVAFARALYGNPSVIVLDEPNSNLDAIGEQSLGRTLTLVRNRGATVVIVTHRASMLSFCDDLLVMNSGTIHTFGSRDLILSKLPAYRPAVAANVVGAIAHQR